MSDLGFFSESVDSWGAAEWFDRLAKAIREQDKAVVAGNDIGMLTYQNIAASSAMRLVRDYEANVRAALSNSGAKDREIAELTRERDEEKRRRYVLFDALGSVEKRSEGHKDWAEECARRRVDAEARWCEAALENSTLSDTISTLTSKLEEAEKALEPFAAWPDELGPRDEDVYLGSTRGNITYGDFRLARTTLSSLRSKP